MTNTNNPQWLDDAIIDINKKGPVRRIDEKGDPSVEYMEVVKEGESVSARVKALMDKGISENEAKETAIKEATDRMDGKLEFPDVESYIRFVLNFDKSDIKRSGELTFTMVDLNSVPDERGIGKMLMEKLKSPGDAVKCSYPLRGNSHGGSTYMSGVFYRSSDGSFKFIPEPELPNAEKFFGKEISINYEEKTFVAPHNGKVYDNHMSRNMPSGFRFVLNNFESGVSEFLNSILIKKRALKAQQRVEDNISSFDF